MGCIETSHSTGKPLHRSMINFNMGCIETKWTSFLYDQIAPIKLNLGYIKTTQIIVVL